MSDQPENPDTAAEASQIPGAAETADTSAPGRHAPHIEVLKGNPTDQELAALIAVLGSLADAAPPPAAAPARWGLPVDKLRYPVFSWQRITLQEMTHMRR
ncbi:acyl-CoA carboxylase subunit epsilon [Mycobacterium sp.]|uniref:acyl-CoA carboxylase subunit epsilon n=1 Tax=Mycobacterium sp. TaxID=1785 RepID=UPI003A8A7CD7